MIIYDVYYVLENNYFIMKLFTFLIALFFVSLGLGQEALPYEIKKYDDHGQIQSYNTYWDYEIWERNNDGSGQMISTPRTPHGIYLEFYKNGALKHVGVKVVEQPLEISFNEKWSFI